MSASVRLGKDENQRKEKSDGRRIDRKSTRLEMEKIRLALERGSNLDGLLKYGC